MSDAIRTYRNFLATARMKNNSGLADNVWAMLSTLDHLFDLTLQSYADNRQDIVKLGAKLQALTTAGDQE